MTEIPDLSSETYCSFTSDNGREVRAIGWLGDTVPDESRGDVPDACRRALSYYATAHQRHDGFLGYHECELCAKNPEETHGEFFIDLGGVRYVMPVMILHYIEAHGYCPPEQFITALEQHWLENGESIMESNPEADCVLPEEERFSHSGMM